MNTVEWGNVLYTPDEQKLVLICHDLRHLPPAVVNLYSNRVKYLDLSSNYISNLDWLHLFTNLETLIIDNNLLENDAFNRIKACNDRQFENIKTLSINGNKIENLSLFLNCLKDCFPNLEYLSLLKNPVCPDGLLADENAHTYNEYRNQIIAVLPKLKFLDFTKVRSQFCASIPQRQVSVLKFSLKMVLANLIKSPETRYNPLPATSRPVGDHCGSFGVCLYKYKGKYSEGNRFIMNHDL